MNFKDKKAFDYFYLEKEIKGKRRTIYLTQEEEEILKKLKITNFSRFVKDMIIEKSKEKHIPKTTIKLNEKEENKTIISWNEMSIEDKLEVHIKNIMVDIKLKIEEGNKEIAIKNLQYYIKRLPNNYKLNFRTLN